MSLLDEIDKPTLLINPEIVRQNIAFMAQKAHRQGIRFRPHFKTHQSSVVGEWFRDQGVICITVSSVDMAVYFANHGWLDILIAFPVNVRQIKAIDDLAKRVHLGLLVESAESIDILSDGLHNPVDLWIKVDSGSGRTGMAWDQPTEIARLARSIMKSNRFSLRGLLTHAGFTYSAGSHQEICRRFSESVDRMTGLQFALASQGINDLEISVGDTPGCTLCDDFANVDEIRPGNFVFFDGQMLQMGVCTPHQIAGVLACPVVAVHPERSEAVVYGGAIHLSKDTIQNPIISHYGFIVELDKHGKWSEPIPSALVARLSQEHGIIHLPDEVFSRLKIGDWLGVIPAHVCLTVSALGSYRLLDGTAVTTYMSAAQA